MRQAARIVIYVYAQYLTQQDTSILCIVFWIAAAPAIASRDNDNAMPVVSQILSQPMAVRFFGWFIRNSRWLLARRDHGLATVATSLFF